MGWRPPVRYVFFICFLQLAMKSLTPHPQGSDWSLRRGMMPTPWVWRRPCLGGQAGWDPVVPALALSKHLQRPRATRSNQEQPRAAKSFFFYSDRPIVGSFFSSGSMLGVGLCVKRSMVRAWTVTAKWRTLRRRSRQPSKAICLRSLPAWRPGIGMIAPPPQAKH